MFFNLKKTLMVFQTLWHCGNAHLMVSVWVRDFSGQTIRDRRSVKSENNQ